MMKYILLFMATIHLLSAQPAPALPNKPVAVDDRKTMLKNLIEAGVLLLEGKAYRQFIQAFVDEEDRRKFEQAFGKNGQIDYSEWGQQKGDAMLDVLRTIRDMEPVLMANRACYVSDDIPRGKMSFIFTKGGWFIENKSPCPESAARKPAP